MGKALTDPILGQVEIGEGGVASSIEPTKACLEVPLPRSDLVVVREANQHRKKPLGLIEDHHALFIEACSDLDRLKSEAHAAAWSLFRCR